MKEKLKIGVIGFLILIILGFVCFNFYMKKEFISYVCNVFNGNSYDFYINNIVEYSNRYLENKYILNDKEIILLDDFSTFQEYVKSRKEYDKILEENPFFIDTDSDIIMNKYNSFYNTSKNERDSRVKELNNQLVINYSDLNFEDGVDTITYDDFIIFLFKEDYPKEYIGNIQGKNNVEYVGEKKLKNERVLVFFDKKENKEINVKLNTLFTFLISYEVI